MPLNYNRTLFQKHPKYKEETEYEPVFTDSNGNKVLSRVKRPAEGAFNVGAVRKDKPIRGRGVLFAIHSSKLIANLFWMGISIQIPGGFLS